MERGEESSGYSRDHERVTNVFFVGINIGISAEWESRQSLSDSSQNHVIRPWL